jgi:hypothetical protein
MVGIRSRRGVRCSAAVLLLTLSATALEAATLKVSSFPSGAQVVDHPLGKGVNRGVWPVRSGQR